MLEGKEFAAGDHLTVADLTLVATVSTYEVMNYDFTKFKNVCRWYNKVKGTAPGYKELNEKNVLLFKQMVDSCTKK